ncbi:Cysteine rich receptor like kinase [Parasponia andersonii]|uniref:Cysteine rich receptor like kinase n=1 Tax=Parasponia andersonii TaxID=3476 RepID=A0A2P5AZV4_PARAD|nr:Cysteine rich receptor like kinase [Parasponia andersonii]
MAIIQRTNMAAASSSSSRLIFFLSPISWLLLLSLTPNINAQQGSFFNFCNNDSGFYTPNSTFDTNLRSLLSSLTSNDTSNDWFYSSSFGENPDKVYATGLCRGDLKSGDCRRCLNASKSLLTQSCRNYKEAMGGYRTCTLRYSNTYLYGIMKITPVVYYPSRKNVSSNVDSFNLKLRALMESLTRAVTGGGESSRKFAAGNVTTTDHGEVIYAMVQCSPDLNDPDCNDCIYRGLLILYDYCYGMTSVYIGLPSCNVAYNLTRFYDSSIDTPILLPPSPSPPLKITPALPPVVSLTPTNGTGKEERTSQTVAIAVVPTSFVFIVLLICIWSYFIKRKTKEKQTSNSCENAEEIIEEFSQFDFERIRDATNDFSDANKLGQGGFGAVYKGRLSNGQEIAVKRPIRNSNRTSKHGNQEFKNEVLLVAKLEHRNLVNLLGFCSEKNERILVYEFVPNNSLDRFIFGMFSIIYLVSYAMQQCTAISLSCHLKCVDPVKREQLDWDRRYKIIIGIARGLLYLHEESRLKIIHRDLKASNILLDSEMNPKISDFGTARLFSLEQSLQNTERIVGTYGYMAPEYIQHGVYSVKSDVFSFGVLVLEIISGQKLKKFHEEETLLSYAWKNWNDGKAVNLVDPKMRGGSRDEIVRCIHIGLLCVQEKVVDRPTMGSVVLMLGSSSIFLKPPSRSAYFLGWKCESGVPQSKQSQQNSGSVTISENNVSVTELYPR